MGGVLAVRRRGLRLRELLTAGRANAWNGGLMPFGGRGRRGPLALHWFVIVDDIISILGAAQFEHGDDVGFCFVAVMVG